MHELPGLAYIEPVSGAILLQLAVAAILGGLTCCMKPVRKLLGFTRQWRSRRDQPESPPVAAPQDEAGR